MKIAFLVSTFPSISQTFILDQITGLLDKGHDVDIYTTYSDKKSEVHPQIEKYKLLERTYYLPIIPSDPKIRILKALFYLFIGNIKNPNLILKSLEIGSQSRQLLSMKWLYSSVSNLRKTHYDLIHCHFAGNGLRGVAFQELNISNPKLLTTFHGYDVNNRNIKPGFYRILIQNADIYTANTNFTANKATKLGFERDKIKILPVGLDLSHYQFRDIDGVPKETIKVLTVARLVEKKGIEYAIRGIQKVTSKYSNLQYIIVGDGPLKTELENLAESLGIKRNVQFLGRKNKVELRKIYQDSHIFMLPSVTASNGDMEGQGLVLQEAQAIGLPVISTLHNGIPDGVLDGKSGFLVPEKDVDAIASKLEYLIENPEVWSAMGHAGRQFVEQRYDIHKLNDRLIEIYQSICN